ncbi:META domain-containing protein [Vibrio sinaloensis]|nr:META domain-containing protein [Vibrio sinaloensis]
MSINGEQIQTNNHQTAPFIEIGANLETNGNTGCNNFKGTGELGERKFRVNRMAMTRKKCVQAVRTISKKSRI